MDAEGGDLLPATPFVRALFSLADRRRSHHLLLLRRRLHLRGGGRIRSARPSYKFYGYTLPSQSSTQFTAPHVLMLQRGSGARQASRGERS